MRKNPKHEYRALMKFMIERRELKRPVWIENPVFYWYRVSRNIDDNGRYDRALSVKKYQELYKTNLSPKKKSFEDVFKGIPSKSFFDKILNTLFG